MGKQNGSISPTVGIGWRMGWMVPAVVFAGTLTSRGGEAGARRSLDENPEWQAFIRKISGWDRVEPGTLTLENADPAPVPALEAVACLSKEPAI